MTHFNIFYYFSGVERIETKLDDETAFNPDILSQPMK